MFESLDSPTMENAGEDSKMTQRAEVDTSAPFESVREAVDRFGGSAVWKLQLKQLFNPEKHFEEMELMTVGEQVSKLERDLILKEKETLDVLKELEMTRRTVDGLKMELQKEPTEFLKIPWTNPDNSKVHPILDTEEQRPRNPGLVLMELKQARLNLCRTTSDMAGIRGSIESLKTMIMEEKVLLEGTRERLSSNSAKALSLEEELNRTVSDLSEIRRLRSQKEQFKKMAEASESEVSRLMAEINEMKANTKTADIRYLAAKKIKALANGEDSSRITLPIEEYTLLTHEAQEAEEISRKKIEAAVLQIEEANRSKEDLLMKVEEAAADLETSKKVLEEALKKEAAANREKIEAEAALRKWRSEHGQRRRSTTNNSTKFKHHRRDSRMLDVNGLSLSSGGSRSPLGPTMSIGQILSRKLMGPEEDEAAREEMVSGKPKVSLGQILSRRHGGSSPPSSDNGGVSKLSSKRKKFGFSAFSLQLAGQNKKKKKKRQSRNPGLSCGGKLV